MIVNYCIDEEIEVYKDYLYHVQGRKWWSLRLNPTISITELFNNQILLLIHILMSKSELVQSCMKSSLIESHSCISQLCITFIILVNLGHLSHLNQWELHGLPAVNFQVSKGCWIRPVYTTNALGDAEWGNSRKGFLKLHTKQKYHYKISKKYLWEEAMLWLTGLHYILHHQHPTWEPGCVPATPPPI